MRASEGRAEGVAPLMRGLTTTVCRMPGEAILECRAEATVGLVEPAVAGVATGWACAAATGLLGGGKVDAAGDFGL